MSTARVTGIADLRAALGDLSLQLRRRVLRNALAAGARLVRDEAKRLAPVLAAPVRRKGKVVRQPGTVAKAISVRTSKSARRAGNVGVFVNVKPAKGNARGAQSPTDPFYWRWLEFGRAARGSAAAKPRRIPGVGRARKAVKAVGPIAPARFLQRAAGKLDDALRAFERQVGPAIQRANRRKA